MGLSSSQARMLTLTARQHSIEYQAQRVQAMKLQLANESDQVYKNYLERLDATKVQYKVVEQDGSIRYDDATFQRLVNATFLFKVGDVICRNYDEVKEQLKEQHIVELTSGDTYTTLSNLISEGYVTVLQPLDEGECGFEYEEGMIKYRDSDTGEYWIMDETGKLRPKTDEEKEDDAYNELESIDLNLLDEDGHPFVYKVFGDTSVATSTKIQEVADEVNLRKAEAQYEADMNRINKKDARYDTELSQLETERNAIKLEIDTLKSVSHDNVDRTFKIFS